MEIKQYHLKITFITPVLGAQPQRDIAKDHLGKRFEEGGGQLPDDELATLDEELERGTTAFHKLPDGQPIFYDYQLKGFIKEAGRIFNGLRGVKGLKSKLNNFLFVTPRQIPLVMPDGAVIEYLERPLRAETMRGPRVAIARSEMLPAGTWFECRLEVYDGPITKDIIVDLLSYGTRQGLGQWRNGGWGKFEFELRQGVAVKQRHGFA
jgi:hypothetical protein